MAQAFYSMVLDHSAEAVWQVIRSFGAYAWSGVVADTVIEDDKAGDQVGAVRRVRVGDTIIRQHLLAHSDLERFYSYAFLEPAPVRNYQATIRVIPVVETDQALVCWSARFDCAPEEIGQWTHHFVQNGFAVWLSALRRVMAETDS
ncbi:MAG: SRPBCC family protein [Acetobacteraceae bacterium]|nr:SRPBCC family protein [Pseudomonadota bacterium]